MTRRRLFAASILAFATLFSTLVPSLANAGTPLVVGERLVLPSKVMGEEDLKPLTAFLAGGDVKARALFFTSGDEGPEMRDVLGQVTAALKATASNGLRWGSANYPDENHGSVVLPSHYAALRMIFDGWSIPVDPATERLVGTLDDVKKRYAGLSERLGFAVTAPEISVNSLGDALEASGALEDALASFTKAAELGQKSGDANTKFFKANADRVRVKIATQAEEAPVGR